MYKLFQGHQHVNNIEKNCHFHFFTYLSTYQQLLLLIRLFFINKINNNVSFHFFEEEEHEIYNPKKIFIK